MTIRHFNTLMVAIFVIPALICTNLTLAGLSVSPLTFAGVVFGSVAGWLPVTVADLRARRREVSR